MAAAPHLGRSDRRLLPASLLAELDPAWSGHRSLRDWLVDATVFVLSCVVGAFILREIWGRQSAALHVVEGLLGVPCLLAIWWRRRFPVALAVIAGLASVVSGLAVTASLVGVFTVAVHRSPRTVGWVLVLSLLTVVPYHLVYPPAGGGFGVQDTLFGLVLTAAVAGWGTMVRLRRQLVLSLRDRAERAESEQLLQVDRARRAERARIAREMHDVLAHRVSLVSLHAGALEYRRDASPEEVAIAAGVIRASARDALQELRQVIGVLREEDEGGAPEPPQPGLGDLDELLEDCRSAGMRVAAAVDVPDASAAPGPLGRTAYRIVQEGLTNARKHAPGAAVEVSVHGAPGRALHVAVRNRVPVGVPSDALLPGAGTGLVGLAERASLADGELAHGVRDGRFVLEAELPWR